MSSELIRFRYTLERLNDEDKKAETTNDMEWPLDTAPQQVEADIIKELKIACHAVLIGHFDLDVTP